MSDALETVWNGATMHFCHPWSSTKGELISWLPQRVKPLGAIDLPKTPDDDEEIKAIKAPAAAGE